MYTSSPILQYLPIAILAVAMIIYWVMAYFLIYHLTRFGVGAEPKMISFVFLLGSILLTIISIAVYNQLTLT